MLIRSGAGMGKSALLAELTERAGPGHEHQGIQGVAGEADFGFAALQRLLIPFMDGYADCPSAADALGAAIGAHGTQTHRTGSWSDWPRSRCWPSPTLGDPSC